MICRICKQEIKPKDTDITQMSKSAYYHKQCYIDKHIKSFTEEELIEKVNKGQEIYLQQKNKKLQEHFSGLNKQIYDTRDVFVKWIYENYDLTTLPSNWFAWMNGIEKGKAKEVREPISSADLLEMFKMKKHSLDRITKNKKFKTNYSKFLYHFKVILNKYDSYKKYKERLDAQRKQEETTTLLDKEVTNSLINATMQHQVESIDVFEGGDEL